MTTLISQLRAMARHEHDDLTIAAEAADEIERLREALQRISDLVYQLPGGIDLDADEDESSPADMVAHTGGLIAQQTSRALGKED